MFTIEGLLLELIIIEYASLLCDREFLIAMSDLLKTPTHFPIQFLNPYYF